MENKEYDALFTYEFKEEEKFVNIIALKKNKIGILFETSFNIFDSNTFVKLLTIQENNIIFDKIFEIIDEQKEFIILISSEEYYIYQIEKKTKNLIQKEKLLQNELITKISETIFIIYNDFKLYYYKYNKKINKFSIIKNYFIYDPPLPDIKPTIPKNYFEWIISTYKIKRMNYLPSYDSLLLYAGIKSRSDFPFSPHGHADIPLIGIAESEISIYQHDLIFEYTLTGDYIQKVYEFEPIYIKCGILYKNGKVKINDYIFNEYEMRRIEELKICLVNKNILALRLDGYTLLINLEDGRKEKAINFPWFFGFDDALYLNKNKILIIGERDRYYYRDDEIWEYTILNKEGIDIEKYDYSKKKIFSSYENGLKKAEIIKGIKIKNKIVYFISTPNKNYIKCLKY